MGAFLSIWARLRFKSESGQTFPGHPREKNWPLRNHCSTVGVFQLPKHVLLTKRDEVHQLGRLRDALPLRLCTGSQRGNEVEGHILAEPIRRRVLLIFLQDAFLNKFLII